MKKFSDLIPPIFTKDWMLYASAILTWSLVSYLSLVSAKIDGLYFIRAVSLVAFIVLFLLNVSSLVYKFGNIKVQIIIFLQVLIVWLLIYYDHYGVAPILLVLISTQLAHLYTKKQTLFILLIMNSGFYLMAQYQSEHGFFSVLTFALLQLFAYSAMDTLLKAERDREKLAEINQELLATRFMLKESSQRQERLRISRDLHDVIGHQLTALSLNLEVSYHKVPDEFKSMLQENLKQAKMLLSDVRQVVKEIRSEEQFDLLKSLNGLMEQLPNCQLEVIKLPEINSLSLKQQLMFCLQEGISNALRHGKANQLTLNSDKNNNHLIITLSDNGLGSKFLTMGSGLNGMKERISGFNGDVQLLSDATGCTLKITVEDCYD